MVQIRTDSLFIIALSLAATATARHVGSNRPSIAASAPFSTALESDLSPTSSTQVSVDTATPTATTPLTDRETTGGTYTGDITHYEVGLGSCGTTNSDSEAVCALSVAMMANGANPNSNPKCQKTITLFNPRTGKNTKAKIVDTCQGCAYEDVDLSPSLFTTVAPAGDGRVSGIQWSFD